MSVELVPLALLMAVVTYAARALPLLVPGVERLPPLALDYLRLVAPASLAAVAAVNALVLLDAAGSTRLRLGVELVAVLVAVATVVRTRSLLLGLVLAVLLVAGARALGLAAPG